LLAATGTAATFAATAAAFLWSALMVSRIRGEALAKPVPARERRRFLSEASAGFGALKADADVRLLVGLYAAQTLVGGAMNVLLVVAAIELLDLGDSGVGFLYSAIGIGGVVGALVAAALLGRRRLAGDFRAGMLLYGVPIVLLGVIVDPVAALILMAVLGVGSTIIDVAALTLMQRAVRDDVLARVFGVLESVLLATLGLGAILAPVLIELVGVRASLVATGALLPALGLLTWHRLSAIDRRAVMPERELELLRSLPLFAPLPAPTLEHLAASLTRVAFAKGDTIVREGEPGERFYVVGEGTVEVSSNTEVVRTLGPGDYFGEIALLRDVPRTATVTARDDVEVFALDREEFVAAVTGNPASAEEADAVIGTRIGSLRADAGSV
jgi:hypothetical protein